VGVLQRFERRLGGLVEGIFARAFKSEVQPVEVAAALQRELDAQAAVVARDRTLVPNHFAVELGDHDYERLAPYEKPLTKELAAMVREHAGEQRYSFVGAVEVELRHEPALETGVFRVHSDVVAGPDVAPIDLSQLSAAGNRGGGPAVVQTAATAVPVSADGYGRLIVREGKNASYEVELRQPVTVIGRGADVGVRLADQAVSRRHAEIRVSDDGTSVSDLKSTNGTLLNGARVTTAALVDGDELRVGETVLIFQSATRD
jgi:FHA domain-containing protein/type III secretion system (T3SS) inner membrane Yop/YscD-like protein